MTSVTLLAAVAGLVCAAGLVCVAAALIVPPRQAVPGPPPRWRVLLARWRITPRLTLIALAAAVAALAVTGWPVAAIATMPAVIALPRVLSRRPGRARIARLEALETWTRRLADILAASRGLEDAITHSASSAPPPIAAAVTALAGALQRPGGTEQALRKFADSVDDPIGDLIAAALILAADRRGPGVGQVLNELADAVAEDVAARREVEAERATYRTTLAWIIAFVLLYTIYLLVRRSYSAPFGTPLGQAVLAVVAACYATGIFWLHRLSLTGDPARFLHGQAVSQQLGTTSPPAPGAPVSAP